MSLRNGRNSKGILLIFLLSMIILISVMDQTIFMQIENKQQITQDESQNIPNDLVKYDGGDRQNNILPIGIIFGLVIAIILLYSYVKEQHVSKRITP